MHASASHALTFLLSFFFPPPPPSTAPPAPFPCISDIISLRKSSLIPPPLRAGECRGRMVPIFQPRGMAGVGIGLLGSGGGS